MKTIRLTLLAVAAVLVTALNSCRKDIIPAPVASELRDSSAMGPLALRHFKCRDPKKTLSEGLLAYYPFSGSADDWSGNGYNGVVTGATLTAGKPGCKNSAYSFNGESDYIEFPFSFDSDTTQFSLYARVKRGANGTIFSKGENRRVDQTILSVSSDSTSIAVELYWQRVVPSVAHIKATNVGVDIKLAPQNRWEDIVVTLDYPELKIYINGKRVGSFTVPYSLLFPNYNGLPLAGASQSGIVPSRGFLTGVIDEMRFYTRPLTAEEIDYLYRH